MSKKRIIIFGILLVAIFVAPIRAQQYSDLDMGMSTEERDELLRKYNNIFPIFGRKVLERGIRLPASFGINLNYFAASQKILISNIAIGVNDSELVDLSSVIIFEDVLSEVENVNARIDLWVLPFLNVYGIFGQSWATTTVNISAPFTFQSIAKLKGSSNGVGFTVAGGLQGFWFALDTNWTWSNLDLLEDAVRTRTFGLRVGKKFRWRDKSVSLWVGAMKMNLESGTEGTVTLSEVMPEIPPELGERYQEWYDGLTLKQKVIADGIKDAIDNADLGSTQVHYVLDKRPLTPWTMNIGAQLEFSRNWQFRAEVNFLGSRTSILANLVYRFDF